MPLSKLITLKAGDRVHVRWAKDDNPDDLRINEVLTVRERSERTITPKIGKPFKSTTISFDEGDIDVREEERPGDHAPNSTDWNGRGYAYFHEAP
jgi:hypothetical protein